MKLFPTSKEALASLTEWLVVFLCFAYPYPTCLSLALETNSTPINIAFRSLYLAMSLYLIFMSFLKKDTKIPSMALPLIFFWIIYVARILYDKEIRNIYTDHTKTEIYSFALGNIFFPMFSTLLYGKYINLERIKSNALWVLFGANLLIITFYFKQISDILTPAILLERAAIYSDAAKGYVINPISFSLYGGYLLIISLHYFLINQGSKKRRYVLIAAALLGLINLLLGASRGPLAITVASSFYLLLLHFKAATWTFNYVRRLLVTISILLGTYVFAILPLVSNFNFAIFGRVEQFVDERSAGKEEERDNLIRDAYEQFLDSPIFGDQMVSKTWGTYPHNIPMEVLMALGIVGGFLFSLILLSFAIKFLNSSSYGEDFSFALVLFMVAAGMTLTSGCLYQSVDYWNLAALVLCIPKQKVKKYF